MLSCSTLSTSLMAPLRAFAIDRENSAGAPDPSIMAARISETMASPHKEPEGATPQCGSSLVIICANLHDSFWRPMRTPNSFFRPGTGGDWRNNFRRTVVLARPLGAPGAANAMARALEDPVNGDPKNAEVCSAAPRLAAICARVLLAAGRHSANCVVG